MKKGILCFLVLILLLGCSTNDNSDKPIPSTTSETTTSTITTPITTESNKIENLNSYQEYQKCKVNMDENAYIIAYDLSIDDRKNFDEYVTKIILKNTCLNQVDLPNVYSSNNIVLTKGVHTISYTLMFLNMKEINIVARFILYDDINELKNMYKNINPNNIISKDKVEKDLAIKQEKLKEKGLDSEMAKYMVQMGLHKNIPWYNLKNVYNLETYTSAETVKIILDKIEFADKAINKVGKIERENERTKTIIPVEVFYQEYEKFFGHRNINLDKLTRVYAGNDCSDWRYDSNKKILFHYDNYCHEDNIWPNPYMIDRYEKVGNIYNLYVIPINIGSGILSTNYKVGFSDYDTDLPITLNYVNIIGQKHKKNYFSDIQDRDDIPATIELNKEIFYQIKYSIMEKDNGDLVFNGIQVIPPTKR